jgi:glc operon protein GlcG
MTLRLSVAILSAFLGFSGAASAQQANPLDVIPDKMPFSTPYGPPITLARAQAAIAAATAEAQNRSWALNVAVVDSGGNLVAFARMDGAQLASISISEHKARVAVKFRRPTKVFEEGIQKNDYKYQPADRGREADRRDWLFRRRGIAGRGRLHGRRGDGQQIDARGDKPARAFDEETGRGLGRIGSEQCGSSLLNPSYGGGVGRHEAQ